MPLAFDLDLCLTLGMDQNTVISDMEAFAERHKLKLTTIGQMAVANRNAYARMKAGTAQISTVQRIAEWMANFPSPSDTSPRSKQGVS